MDFISYSMSLPPGGKDPVFAILNYIISLFTDNSYKLYLIILGGLTYSFLCISVYKFGKSLKVDYVTIIFCVAAMALLPYIFTISAHLIRQFVAASILFYVMVQRFFYDKKCWILIVLMILIHSSVVFFVPFIILPFFSKPISKKNITYYIIGVVCMLGMSFIAGALLPFLSPISSLEVAASRVRNNEYFEGLDTLNLPKIALNIFLCVLLFFLIYVYKKYLKSYSGLMHFVNIFFVLITFIFINIKHTELAVRYNFFVWLFIPFFMVLFLSYIKISRFIYFLSFLFLVIFFYMYLSIGTWTYKVGKDFFFNTFLYYII